MTGRPLRKAGFGLVRAFVVLLGVLLVASHFDELNFMLDNLSNFPLHLAGAFLACAAVLAIARDLRWAIMSILGVALSLVPIVQWYVAERAEPAPATAAAVKLLVSNVYFHNRNYARLIRLVQQERPDVVGLVEVNSRWLEALGPLRAEFPHRFEVPDEHYFGLALYSRLPLLNARILRVSATATPAIAATLQLPDGEIELILVHAIPPLNAEMVRRRNAQLRDLGSFVGALQRPVVVTGDLNVTMWNRNYRILAGSSGLRNARAGSGIGTSWPAVRALGLPIDHILGSASVQLRNFRVLSAIGSDHFPVSAELSLGVRESRNRADPREIR